MEWVGSLWYSRAQLEPDKVSNVVVDHLSLLHGSPGARG